MTLANLYEMVLSSYGDPTGSLHMEGMELVES